MSVTVIGKVKRSDIVRTIIRLAWAVFLFCYHHLIRASTPVLFIMFMIVADVIYDAVFVLIEYRKQRKKAE